MNLYLVLPLYLVTIVASQETMSIMGQPLKSCSQPGTAMTGFTRDGRCADVGPADKGSHHVCIQMKEDFCTVTGQPNWCTTRSFPCMGKSGNCKIGNWCVCQWAFSRYLERAGGCDSIVDLVCDATNQAAFDAYSRSGRAADKAALDCMKRRCGFVKPAEEQFSALPHGNDSIVLMNESDASEIKKQDNTLAPIGDSLSDHNSKHENTSCSVQGSDGYTIAIDGGSCSS